METNPADHWRRVRALLEQALDLPPAGRPAFLAAACGPDDALRGEVEALLAAEAAAGGLLETPVQAAAGDLVGALAETQSAASMAGRQIGPYRLLTLLGEGGMGLVYLAERADFKKQVALKLIRPGHDSAEVLRRFVDERQILASLDHPNIARLLDGGVTEDGQPYFVMEYVEGLEVDRYCDRHRLGVADRLRLFRTICAAVHYAHQNLIVHRDLKPSNILVTDDGTVKLLDFGIAKVLAPQAAGVQVAVTRTEMRLMTPAYASPEQILGEPITTAADVYALGVLLYELLTGHRPYRLPGRLHHEIARVILEEEPTRPSTAITEVEDVPHGDGTTTRITPDTVGAARSLPAHRLKRRLRGDLDNIVLMAMRKEPGRRYGSVEQLGEDLQRHLAGLPVRARKDTLGYRTRKFVGRHRLGVGMTAVAVLSMLGGLGAAVWQGRVAAQERDLARVEAEKARQVSAFMVEVFKGADPYGVHGDSLLVLDLLDEGTRRAETELAGQPDVQAAMFEALGQTYISLSRYREANDLLERALDVRRKRYGADHPDVAASLFALGAFRREQSTYEAADTLLRQALAIRLRHFGEDHVDVGRTMQHLGWLLNDRGDEEAGRRMNEQAVAILERHLGPSHQEVAEGLRHLGHLSLRQNAIPGADSLLRRVLAIETSQYGPEHPHVASALLSLGRVEMARDSFDAAARYFRASADLFERTVGPFPSAVPLNALALIHMRRNDFDGAAPLLERVVDLFSRQHGPDHRFTITARRNLAGALEGQGAYDEAETLYRRTLADEVRLLGRDHAATAITIDNLAGLLLERGRLDEAEAQYREALAIRRRLYPDGHLDIGSSLTGVGRVLMARGRAAAAEPVLREALDVITAARGPGHRRTGVAQSDLGHCLTTLGRYAEAESLLTQALDVLRATMGDDASLTVECRRRLRALYTAWGRPDRAAAFP